MCSTFKYIVRSLWLWRWPNTGIHVQRCQIMCSAFKYIVRPLWLWWWPNAGIHVQRCQIMCSTFKYITDLFDCEGGLMQGEICSPILSSTWKCGCWNNIRTVVIIFNSCRWWYGYLQGLQLSLYRLQRYCNSWNLTVNPEKTKVMVFRKDRRL